VKRRHLSAPAGFIPEVLLFLAIWLTLVLLMISRGGPSIDTRWSHSTLSNTRVRVATCPRVTATTWSSTRRAITLRLTLSSRSIHSPASFNPQQRRTTLSQHHLDVLQCARTSPSRATRISAADISDSGSTVDCFVCCRSSNSSSSRCLRRGRSSLPAYTIAKARLWTGHPYSADKPSREVNYSGAIAIPGGSRTRRLRRQLAQQEQDIVTEWIMENSCWGKTSGFVYLSRSTK
jgi:hypothetical protein